MNKSIVLISIGRVIQIVIGMLTIRLVSRFLSPDELGTLFLIMAVTGYFSFTLISPAGLFFMRRLHSWQMNQVVINRLLLYLCYILAITGFSFITTYLAKQYFNFVTYMPPLQLASLVAFGLFSMTINQTIIPTLNMFLYRTSYIVFTNIGLLLGLLFAILLVNTQSKEAYLWFVGIQAGALLTGIIALLYLSVQLKESVSITKSVTVFNTFNTKRLLAYILPLSISTGLLWAFNDGYRFFIEQYIDLTFLGYFSIGIAISMKLAAAIESLLVQIFTPHYFKKVTTDCVNERATAFNFMFEIVTPIHISTFIFIFAGAPFLATILSNYEYTHIYKYICYGAFIQLFRMMINNISSIAHSEYKTRYLIFPYLIGLLSIVVMIYLSLQYLDIKQTIPIILPIAGLLVLLQMIKNMKKILDITLNMKTAVIPTLLSLPMLIAYFFSHLATDIVHSILIACTLGIYYLCILLLIYKKNQHSYYFAA